MPLQVTTIMLGVESLDRAKKFYAEGMGATIGQDYPNFVSLSLDGGSGLALYERSEAAADAGVPAEGSGFRGVSTPTTSSTRPRSWTRSWNAPPRPAPTWSGRPRRCSGATSATSPTLGKPWKVAAGG